MINCMDGKIVKQKYNAKFFYDNYSNTYPAIFNKYIKKVQGDFRYFITCKKRLSEFEDDIYYSNLNISLLIEQFKKEDYLSVTIKDLKKHDWTSPSMYEILESSTLNSKEKKVFEVFENRTRVYRLKKYNGEIIQTSWESKQLGSILINKTKIKISYKDYKICCDLDTHELNVYRNEFIPYDDECKNIIFKLYRELEMENKNDFYRDILDTIKKYFG
ncbi:TPA: hypothetical protein ACG3QY_001687 [Clostridioides difficile]